MLRNVASCSLESVVLSAVMFTLLVPIVVTKLVVVSRSRHGWLPEAFSCSKLVTKVLNNFHSDTRNYASFKKTSKLIAKYLSYHFSANGIYKCIFIKITPCVINYNTQRLLKLVYSEKEMHNVLFFLQN